ncbi:HAD-IA family hydrolase [Variovorax sp. M-6]|uniref:HAD-IA family hydrolase n=1 Tax=Variovorax sp. M-6 TaxID=3233041 RepID=UPI003F990CF8
MTFQAIAFDLDGTLVDSAGGIALALNTALREADLRCFDLQRVRGWIGDGPDVLIERALRAIDPQDVDLEGLSIRLRRGFDAVTLRLPFADSSVYAGVEDLLNQLGRDNMPLAVVTNKPTELARAVLEGAGLLGHFAAVHGADTAALRKPSPLLIEQAAQVLGAHPRHMLMVGDAATDCLAARAAGCRAAWAGWGYGLLDIEQSESVWRLDRPADLLVRMSPPQAHCH